MDKNAKYASSISYYWKGVLCSHNKKWSLIETEENWLGGEEENGELVFNGEDGQVRWRWTVEEWQNSVHVPAAAELHPEECFRGLIMLNEFYN